jgi:hypothetical protein
MQAQTTRTHGSGIRRWISAALVATLLAMLALVAFSILDTTAFRGTVEQAHVATQLETRHDLSNHRHTELTSMITVPVVQPQPATRFGTELVLAGHRHNLYLNEGLVTSSESEVPAASRPTHRYDLLEQLPSSTDDYPTHHRVAQHDR